MDIHEGQGEGEPAQRSGHPGDDDHDHYDADRGRLPRYAADTLADILGEFIDDVETP